MAKYYRGTGHGPSSPINGTLHEYGYYGILTEDEFISSQELVNLLKITCLGVNPCSWYKVSAYGRIMFIPTTPVAYGVSRALLENNGLVHGHKAIKIGDHTYSVRLAMGNTDTICEPNIASHHNQLDWAPIISYSPSNTWTDYKNSWTSEMNDYGYIAKSSPTYATSHTPHSVSFGGDRPESCWFPVLELVFN